MKTQKRLLNLKTSIFSKITGSITYHSQAKKILTNIDSIDYITNDRINIVGSTPAIENLTTTTTSTTTTTTTVITYVVGDSALGGRIAYILQPGDPGYISGEQHGLVATTNDISTGASWGCQGTLISGADGIILGTGNQNTIDIMAGCATSTIAARRCGDLVQGGFSDWYLPSKDELNKLYINRVAIGNFVSDDYWSSTEDSSTNANIQSFANGIPGVSNKSAFYYVRAVRSF